MPGPTFPTSLDTFPTITSTTQEDDTGFYHDDMHNLAFDAIAAVEAKVGADGSTDADSLDHRVAQLESLKAPLASPALTGTPTAPTAAAGTNTTQLATTEYVQAELDGVRLYFRRDDFTAAAGDKEFTFDKVPLSGTISLYKAGALLSTSDYTIDTGATGNTKAILGTVASAGDKFIATYWNTSGAALATILTNGVALAFDPSEKSSNITLSVVNTKMENASGVAGVWGTTLGTSGQSSGKLYVELHRDSKNGVGYCGAGIGTARPSTYPGSDSNSWAHLSDGYKAHSGYSSYGVAWDTVGDVFMIAFDIDNGKLWFGKNGTWMGSGDPGAGTNPSFSSIPAGTYKIIAGAKSDPSANGVTINQSPTYTVPTGFSYWPSA